MTIFKFLCFVVFIMFLSILYLVMMFKWYLYESLLGPPRFVWSILCKWLSLSNYEYLITFIFLLPPFYLNFFTVHSKGCSLLFCTYTWWHTLNEYYILVWCLWLFCIWDFIGKFGKRLFLNIYVRLYNIT